MYPTHLVADTSQRSNASQTLRGEPVFHLHAPLAFPSSGNGPLQPLSCSSPKRGTTADARLPPSAVSPPPSPASSISKSNLLSAHFPPSQCCPGGHSISQLPEGSHPPCVPCLPLSPASFSTRQPERSLKVERQTAPLLCVKPSKTSLCSRNKNPNPCRDLQVPTRLGSSAAPLSGFLPAPYVSWVLPATALRKPCSVFEHSFPALHWQVSARPSGHFLRSCTPALGGQGLDLFYQGQASVKQPRRPGCRGEGSPHTGARARLPARRLLQFCPLGALLSLVPALCFTHHVFPGLSTVPGK